MLKLISLNMETIKHYATIVPFLTAEDADVLCLQEIPEAFIPTLTDLGYQVSFAPLCKQTVLEEEVVMGVAIGTKAPHTAKTVYYYEGVPELSYYNSQHPEHSLRLPYLLADIQTAAGEFSIATTHLLKSPHGKEDDIQTRIFTMLLEQLTTEKPHIICGDFNMPRGFNALYPRMCEHYTDNIPAHYASSLDPELHRLSDAEASQNIFADYMVDYIFTQTPYTAHDVRLQFGVSDHAAVVGYIEKTTLPSHS